MQFKNILLSIFKLHLTLSYNKIQNLFIKYLCPYLRNNQGAYYNVVNKVKLCNYKLY